MVGCRFLLALMALTGWMAVGCGGTTDTAAESASATGEAEHDHEHEHADPKTLAEAVAVLTETRDELAEAYKAGDASEVDHAWHEMYPVAEKSVELASSSGLDRYDEEDAKAAANQIVEILGELHPPHGADAKVDPADYEGQADSLNDAIDNLKKFADKSSAAEGE